MTVDLQGFPTGQKMTLKVDYPDGSTVPMGNRYAGAPDAVGWTHMAWTWTVPAAMTSGAAKASWSGTCIEGRNENGYGDFTVIGPAPTPNWSVWSTAYQAWPGGPGQVEVQAYYGAMCTVTVTYPDARTQIVGTIEYVGTQLSFLWTVPTDVPIGTGSYHISCSLNGAIRTGDGALIITAHP